MIPVRRASLLLLLAFAGCRAAPAPVSPPLVPSHQDPTRWAQDIEAFARQDRESPAPPGVVVFVGSSSIRLWSSLAEDMAPVPVLNRGFGGSQLFDSIHYAGELVSVHRPSLVVVFSGTNDIAGDDARSAEEVRDLFRLLVARLRRDDPRLTVCFIAITPTLAREEHLATVREANRLIRLDCEADDRLEFIDPTPDLADTDGRPDPRFFQDDRLHLDASGYAVWTRHVRPVVLRLYERERSRTLAGG